MQDSQNTRPKVERFKRLYRTILDELPRIRNHNSEATFRYTQPPAMPVLGIQPLVQLVHDPTIPACLMNGLDLYAEGLEENQLEDAALERAQQILSAFRGSISQESLQMEVEDYSFFFLAVGMPVHSLCQSIGLDATYRNGSTARNITPDHAWKIGTEPIAVFEHKSPTVADIYFPDIVSKAQENRILDLSMWTRGPSENILAKVRTS
ncbi:hypothetical protein FRC05_010561 [Tulasnella sp. 425]|nr:hypothetical protein FRC05_010561 [Tulasnella sp. 425]